MKKRKLLLGLAGVSAIALPVLSSKCGNTDEEKKELKVEAAKDVKLTEITAKDLKVEQLTVTAPKGYEIKKGSIKITDRKEEEGTVVVHAIIVKDKKEETLKYTLKGLKKYVAPAVEPELEVKAADGVELSTILPSELKAEQIVVTATEGYAVKADTIKLEEAKDEEGTVTVKATATKDAETKELTFVLTGLKKYVAPAVEPKLEVKAADGVELSTILPSELKAEQIVVTATEGYTIKADTIKLEEAKDEEGTVTVKATATKDAETKELTFVLTGLKKA